LFQIQPTLSRRFASGPVADISNSALSVLADGP
jgi:hypothetical protein